MMNSQYLLKQGSTRSQGDGSPYIGFQVWLVSFCPHALVSFYYSGEFSIGSQERNGGPRALLLPLLCL